MTQSQTTTRTFTRTNARYVARKVAADLRQFQQAYRQPSDLKIQNLTVELAAYLADGYLDYVEYGFKRGDDWVVGNKYTAAELNTISTDDRSGRIRRGADITGARWHSYLVQNAAWDALTSDARAHYKAALPIKRSFGVEPRAKGGWASDDKSYAAGGGGVRRSSTG